MRRFREAWKDPSGEYWRAILPFWLFCSLTSSKALLPVAVLILIVEPDRAWLALLVPIFGFAAGTILFGGLEALGRLSDYRSFNASWTINSAEDLEHQTSSIRRITLGRGFEIRWQTLLGGFVAVAGQVRAGKALWSYSAAETPLRLLLEIEGASAPFIARLKLQVHSCVLWDTGEKERLAKLGKKLLKPVAFRPKDDDEIPSLVV